MYESSPLMGELLLSFLFILENELWKILILDLKLVNMLNLL